MPIVAIVNQKGGTGKTTLATNLACAFAGNSPVLLLDADAQGSSQDWADSQPQRRLNLEVRGAEPGRLLQDVRRLAAGYGWVIIDGPAGISRTSADAVRAADLVLIPAKPSPLDVWGRLGHRGGGEGQTGVLRRRPHGRLRDHHVQTQNPPGRPDRGGPGGVRPSSPGVPHHRAGLLPPYGHRRGGGAGREGPDRPRGDPGHARRD